jgi:hypothetical protein
VAMGVEEAFVTLVPTVPRPTKYDPLCLAGSELEFRRTASWPRPEPRFREAYAVTEIQVASLWTDEIVAALRLVDLDVAALSTGRRVAALARSGSPVLGARLTALPTHPIEVHERGPSGW